MIGILKRHEGVQLLERLCTWITSGGTVYTSVGLVV